MPSFVSVTVKNASATIARIHAADQACQDAVRQAVRDAGEFCRELTQATVPVDTGFLRDNVVTTYRGDGLQFETGWRADDFLGAGKPFYAPYVEFGTRRMAARPSLGPAYEETRRYFSETLRALLRAAVARRQG